MCGSLDFEISVHTIPSTLRREIRHVFPILGNDRDLLIVATNQKAEQNLINWGEDVTREKVSVGYGVVLLLSFLSLLYI